MGIIGTIGKLTKKGMEKADQYLHKPPDPETERRKIEDERIRELTHRERLLRADEIAKARIDLEVNEAKRKLPERKELIKNAPQKPPRVNWGGGGMNMNISGGGNLLGSTNRGKKTGTNRRNPMDDLSNFGTGGGGRDFMGLGEFAGEKKIKRRK